MTNPYSSPTGEPGTPFDGSQGLPQPQAPGLVGQVRILAILMIIQGVLELIMGVFLLFMSVMAMTVMKDAFADMPRSGDGPGPEVMSKFLFATYATMGGAGLLLGVLHTYAGYLNFDFRSRTMGIVGAAGGLVSALTCYCLPTGLALCIYGLIVLLNGPVGMAFDMRRAGYSTDAILATFSRYHYEQTRGQPT
jgi:hypothetical protein